MTFHKNSTDWLWLGLTLFPLVCIALLLPLSPQDYWWYLRLGQDIVNSGAVPAVDSYSFTRAGATYFYQAWLAAILFWKTYQIGGLLLTFILRGLIVVATYALLWLLACEAGAGSRLASLLTFIAALVGSGNWSFRPQLFTYPLFVLAVYVLYRWRQGKDRGVWLLPVLALLWVNLHGSYPLLFALGYLTLLFGRGHKKPLGAAMGLATIAIFANPHGTGALGYVVQMLTAPSNQLSIEWAPLVNRGWQANLFFAWLLAFAPLVAVSPHKLTLLDWTLFLAFGWLALSGLRYVIWFSFLLALATASLLAEWGTRFIDRPIKHERPALNLMASLLLLSLPFATTPGIRERWWPGAPSPFDDTNPIAATAWLAVHPELAGPLFSDLSHSSYLIFALPSRPVWIDPRFELFPVSQWERYAAIVRASPQWQSLLDEEGLNLLMLSTAGEPLLIASLQSTTEWCQIYQDDDAVIFSRSGMCP